MGSVIDLAKARRARERQGTPRPTGSRRGTRATFFFDLSCPFTYLGAERVERWFDDIEWRPASAAALCGGALADQVAEERVRRAAEQRAATLRLPLQWPDAFPADAPAAMRAAAYAADAGRGGPFVLAAGRLAFCGGFDLEDPEILAEAAAAAGVSLDGCLDAAGDASRDGAIEADARRLLVAGADQLPALRIGRSLYWGERRVAEAAAAARFAIAAVR